jgi:hypothetical protein
MDTAIVVLVVGLRLFVPLLIFRWPLPAMLACLVIDGIDQTIFQQFTSIDLTNYQSYDKALDIYYLSLAYISTFRNWSSRGAFEVSRFLWYYRLVGVTLFELSNDVRALLLIFPNTFEYFFDFYEGVRSRWNPARLTLKFWVYAAGAIWVFIKLPQEWWIHIAQIDTTDLIRDKPWVGVLMVVGVLGLRAGFWFYVRPRLDPADHDFRLAADPLPENVPTPQELSRQAVFGAALLEKVVLVGLVCVIFAQFLPGLDTTNFKLVSALTVLIVVNALLAHAAARAGRTLDSLVAQFALRAVVNIGLVGLGAALLGSDMSFWPTMFFVLLLTLIVTTYDRYRPVHDVRCPAPATVA